MIDPRFAPLAEVCDAVYLTAEGDGYTALNVLHKHASLEVVPKDGRHRSFSVSGTDLDAMIAEAVARSDGWRRETWVDRDVDHNQTPEPG